MAFVHGHHRGRLHGVVLSQLCLEELDYEPFNLTLAGFETLDVVEGVRTVFDYARPLVADCFISIVARRRILFELDHAHLVRKIALSPRQCE